MNTLHHRTRRQFFDTCGIGLGKIALASLLSRSASASSLATPFAPQATHFAPKAKRVIYLFMAGAPSQLDLFDYKPKLHELAGKPIPPSVIAGQRYAFIQPDAAVLAPCFDFARHGQSGAEFSDRLPHLAKVADELAIIKSVHTDQFNHSPAQLFMNTGSILPGRPAMGSWLSYGIGSQSSDLPSFVVLKSGGSLSGGAAMWSSGFIPTSHAGVPFRSSGDPILHIATPQGLDAEAQRDSLDLINTLNRRRQPLVNDPEIQTRINAYEMAWRMQSAAPELMDFRQESQATLDLYGAEPGNGEKSFANNCLLARRMIERGVRFVQLYESDWDHHSQVKAGVERKSAIIDQPCAALIADLKQRGLLEDTLVVWGGEFGRTPMVEASAALGRSQGRDHHPQAFTMWMAGGGVKPGLTYGATDELGFHIAENPVHVHDLQATILHLLGLDHEKLTYRFQGRDFRLTDVHGHIVKDILA
ncbi:DUF1501 domain-containing protein [Roseibacillus ishigakijimensis]|uniref:DUF1501 domain-containing protein n=1 Tax=Roseibacillus ishigakijimensis TaxID=454146 RepID=A0A934RP85_9BACT|nr:DUF1501 domain-containing protein [Roseibacillus ishigakijimensis]MBK1834443.1 DUF1501 domain-containing protein [Roseibacillus ishigakijimensis]